MGKQTQIVATFEDEQACLCFVRESADIAILETHAATTEALWKQSFEQERHGHFEYFIWNKAFSWTPEYALTLPMPDTTRSYYVSNMSNAPVVQFSRCKFHPIREGRIYWSKYFSAPDGLDYDVVSFSRWYDSLVRWIRKNGQKLHLGAYQPYFLPDAWARRTELA